ncbi:HAD hydrolase-like protein [bacterium]|nr:HAD hydrolase-like protein [bacterium]
MNNEIKSFFEENSIEGMDMNTEIESFFEKNSIEGIVFDLDNTLIDTGTWLIFMYKRFATEIVPYINRTYNLTIETDDFAQAYHQAEVAQYYNNGSVNFITRFPSTLSWITTSLNLNIDQEDILKRFTPNIAEIYTLSPDPFDGTLELLHTLLSFTKVAICTHSGKDWTKIKTDSLKSRYRKLYKNIPDIYSYYVDINKPKNTSEWIKAANTTNSTPEKLIAVGDNFDADILPAVEAGYKYIIWLSLYDNDKEQDIKELKKQGVKIAIIKDIRELEKTLTSNQPFGDI